LERAQSAHDHAIVKVIAHDAASNTGADVSNAAFTIMAPDTNAPTVTVTAPNGWRELGCRVHPQHHLDGHR